MAAKPTANAELELAVATELLIRVRDSLWTVPDRMLRLEELMGNRRAEQLQAYANEILERHGLSPQNVTPEVGGATDFGDIKVDDRDLQFSR